MSTITFNTLKYVEKLKSAGVPEAQAKAEAEALAEALSESLDTAMASRGDIVRLERRLDSIDAKLDKLETRMDGRFTMMQWMLSIIVGGVVMLVMRAFFPVG